MSGKPIKPRPGRPATTPGELRPTGYAHYRGKGLVSLKVWMTPAERDRINSEAEAAGMSTQDFCRQRLQQI